VYTVAQTEREAGRERFIELTLKNIPEIRKLPENRKYY
jgi:hypothetical protein